MREALAGLWIWVGLLNGDALRRQKGGLSFLFSQGDYEH